MKAGAARPRYVRKLLGCIGNVAFACDTMKKNAWASHGTRGYSGDVVDTWRAHHQTTKKERRPFAREKSKITCVLEFLGCPGNSLSTQKACKSARTMRCFISPVVWKPKTIRRSWRRSTWLAQMGPRRSTRGALFASCLRACLVNKNPTIYVHVCPRPCLLEQAKFTTDKRKKDSQLCVVLALMPP